MNIIIHHKTWQNEKKLKTSLNLFCTKGKYSLKTSSSKISRKEWIFLYILDIRPINHKQTFAGRSCPCLRWMRRWYFEYSWNIYHLLIKCLYESIKRQNGWTDWAQILPPKGRFMVGQSWKMLSKKSGLYQFGKCVN